VHANQIKRWKDQRLEGARGVFGSEAKAEPAGPAVDLKTLHAKIGEMTLENDFLAERSARRDCWAERNDRPLAQIVGRTPGEASWRDNVFVERLWRSIKYEEVYLHAYKTASEARVGISRYLPFYNTRRPHSSPDRQTPDQANFNVGANYGGGMFEAEIHLEGESGVVCGRHFSV